MTESVTLHATTHDDLTPADDLSAGWVPTRFQVPSSPVIWERGIFCVHRSAFRTLLVSLMFAVPVLAGRFASGVVAPMPPVFAGLALALPWAFVVSFVHHELAHALVARRYGIETYAVGFHGNGAYVEFEQTDHEVTPQQWIRVLAAGPLSNTLAGAVLLTAWLAMGGGWSSSASVFCLVAGVFEVIWALDSAAPFRPNDGRAILDALHESRPSLPS